MQLEFNIGTILAVCAAGFIAAAVDAIAGGGGIITLPSLLTAGISPHFALGTNKFASSFGSVTSAYTFIKSGKVNIPLMKYCVPCTLLGAAIGVQTVLHINQKYLQTAILIMIFATALYTVLKKDFGNKDNFKGLTNKSIVYGCIIAFSLGFYDGFFGPGTGSFLIFLFITIFGFDFTTASGNSKVLNFVSNITSLVLFAIGGKIHFIIGIPMGLSMMVGARLGSRIAIKSGAKIIKPIFVAIALALTIKLMFETFA